MPGSGQSPDCQGNTQGPLMAETVLSGNNEAFLSEISLFILCHSSFDSSKLMSDMNRLIF